MILLGLTGPIGHGKTTLANALTKLEPSTRHLESSDVVTRVADAWQATLTVPFDPYDIDALNKWIEKLPPILEEKLGVQVSFDQLRLDPYEVRAEPVEYQKLILHAENLRRDFRLAHQPITNDNKESYRPILQWLGSYLVTHVNPRVWYDQLVREAKQAEVEGCQLCIVGGLRYPSDADVIREAGGVVAKLFRPGHLENDLLDPTEREREKIVVDATIRSEGSQEELANTARQLLEDLRSGHLQQTYRSGQQGA